MPLFSHRQKSAFLTMRLIWSSGLSHLMTGFGFIADFNNFVISVYQRQSPDCCPLIDKAIVVSPSSLVKVSIPLLTQCEIMPQAYELRLQKTGLWGF